MLSTARDEFIHICQQIVLLVSNRLNATKESYTCTYPRVAVTQFNVPLRLLISDVDPLPLFTLDPQSASPPLPKNFMSLSTHRLGPIERHLPSSASPRFFHLITICSNSFLALTSSSTPQSFGHPPCLDSMTTAPFRDKFGR